MASRRNRNLFLEINARGDTKPMKQTVERLGRVPGLWRVVPDIGRLLIMERVVDNRDRTRSGGTREVRLAGVFDTPGQLTSIINLIHMAKWDGALTISADQVRKVLYFRRGDYLAGHSNLQHDRIGNMLVRFGMLTAEQRDEVIDEAADGSRLGTQLVSRGMLTTPQVYEGLRKQAEDIFFSVLRFHHGSYYLVEPLDMTEVPAMLRLDTQSLLLEGLRRLDEAAASGAADQEEELRRSQPISLEDLPSDGEAKIIETYNSALCGLFAAIPAGESAALRGELQRFLEDSVVYGDLFSKVEVNEDGTLSKRILSNMRNLNGKEAVTLLQVGLNEMLFFVMFAAGDALEPSIERVLQREVARALQSLPQPKDL